MTTLRIAVDARPLVGYRTGTGQYTALLIEALQGLGEPLELHLFYGAAWSNAQQRDNKEIPHAWRIARLLNNGIGKFGDVAALYRKKMTYHVQKWFFYRGVEKIHPDVIHYTSSSIFPSRFPVVMTVYDLSCFRHPETHPGFRVRWEHEMLPNSLKKVHIILTISEFTKREICDYFDVDPAKVIVTHIGVSRDFRPRDESETQIALQRYGLSHGGFLLAVGTLEPRKNLETLLRAYWATPHDLQRRYPLVIAGMWGWNDGGISNSVKSQVRNGQVRLLGYVPQEDLPKLYNGAATFLYPSIYEGFGIPVLEAMASGTPVLASNASSVPEVVGDAGLLLEPMNIEAWNKSIETVLANETLRAEMISRGLARATSFSWQRCAETTMLGYRMAASRHD